MIPSLASAQRLVVKIGSALVVDPDEAAPRTAWLAGVAADIAALRARGVDVIVVSSGAIALARRALGLHAAPPAAGGTAGRRRGRPDPPGAGLERGAVRQGPHRRAAAADAGRHRGPPPLPERARHAEHAARPRLHPGDQRERHRGDRRNPLRRQRPPGRARRRDGAGRPACAAVRHRRPLHRRSAARSRRRRTFRSCAAITPEIEAMGGEPPPGYSSGGMRTKLVAARIATQAGCAMAIAYGHTERPLAALESGARCTWFLAAPEGRSARKRWIAGALAPLGTLLGRCRRGARACRRPVAAAGRRARGRRHVPARRSGRGAQCQTARHWRAGSPPMPASMPNASPVIAPMRSRRSSAGAVATKSSTATTSSCFEPRSSGRLTPEGRRRCISRPKPPSICSAPRRGARVRRMCWRGCRTPSAMPPCVRWRRPCAPHIADILAANAADLAACTAAAPRSATASLSTEARVEAMARGLEDIAALPDPLGRTLADWTRPNGLRIQRIATPIGVIGMIYESRPNVGADAAGMCLKSGNAVILRGGSESQRSARRSTQRSPPGCAPPACRKPACRSRPTPTAPMSARCWRRPACST